jgi:hypothetical protein
MQQDRTECIKQAQGRKIAQGSTSKRMPQDSIANNAPASTSSPNATWSFSSWNFSSDSLSPLLRRYSQKNTHRIRTPIVQPIQHFESLIISDDWKGIEETA